MLGKRPPCRLLPTAARQQFLTDRSLTLTLVVVQIDSSDRVLGAYFAANIADRQIGAEGFYVCLSMLFSATSLDSDALRLLSIPRALATWLDYRTSFCRAAAATASAYSAKYEYSERERLVPRSFSQHFALVS